MLSVEYECLGPLGRGEVSPHNVARGGIIRAVDVHSWKVRVCPGLSELEEQLPAVAAMTGIARPCMFM